MDAQENKENTIEKEEAEVQMLAEQVKNAKLKQQYACGQIYKVVNKNNPDEFYIGSTRNTLRVRWADHKKSMKSEHFRGLLYVRMRELGFDCFSMVLVEDWPCDNKDQLRQREDYWIRTLRPTLNMTRAYLTPEDRQEYRVQIRAHRVEKDRAWREANKETIAESKRLKREAHKLEISAEELKAEQRRKADYAKEYRDKNKELVLAKRREKIRCEICDVEIVRASKYDHERSEKHKANLPVQPAVAPIIVEQA